MTVKSRAKISRAHGEMFLKQKDSALVDEDKLQSRTKALVGYENAGNDTEYDLMKGNCDGHTLKSSYWKYDMKESPTSALSYGMYRSATNQEGVAEMKVLIRGNDVVEGSTSKIAYWKDLEAAIILLEMAKGLPALPKSDSCFSKKCMEDCDVVEEDVLHLANGLLDGHGPIITLDNKGQQHIDACAYGVNDISGASPLECYWLTKRKRSAAVKCISVLSRSPQLLPIKKRSFELTDEASLKIEEGSHKVDAESDGLTAVSLHSSISKRENMDDQEFTSMTQTVQTAVSFSIVHLFSAIRIIMITPLKYDDLVLHGAHHVNGNSGSKQARENNRPSLTIHEIVQRIRSNPRDPRILETLEPLPDLIRGVLKIFSSKTVPVRAKGWKPLMLYEKSSRSWSWIGPVSLNSLSSQEVEEEELSPEAWGLPKKLLGKLVDCFADWLRKSQEALQQIGNLPAPPMELMQQTVATRKSFGNRRTQRSAPTIKPSAQEVRTYFRREEALRYLIPHKAFPYTAADGRKSMVAPLKRASGKPWSKARDHILLKPDRPAHVTLLCLVRDAIARLPGSIGTREDICTLLRDSQYIKEGTTDQQVNQVVRGGLDRLHYEAEPCVGFCRNLKLWVYLHGQKEEEDFEDFAHSPSKYCRKKQKTAESAPSEEE